jgi:hypothetical protein
MISVVISSFSTSSSVLVFIWVNFCSTRFITEIWTSIWMSCDCYTLPNIHQKGKGKRRYIIYTWRHNTAKLIKIGLKKVIIRMFTLMVNNSTNINKINNQLSPQIIEQYGRVKLINCYQDVRRNNKAVE